MGVYYANKLRGCKIAVNAMSPRLDTSQTTQQPATCCL